MKKILALLIIFAMLATAALTFNVAAEGDEKDDADAVEVTGGEVADEADEAADDADEPEDAEEAAEPEIPTGYNRLSMAAWGKNPLMKPEYIDGGEGFGVKEGSASLLVYDEKSEDFPKYCTDKWPFWAEWKYDRAYLITRILLRTGNDSADQPRRLGDGWTLSGSNDGESWEVIYTGKASDTADENFMYYRVDLPDNDVAYQYYRIEDETGYEGNQIHGGDNSPIIQYSMVILCSDLAVPARQKIQVNGIEVAFDAYNINGYNYFKLRDLAFMLNATEKRFGIEWNEEEQAIYLTSGEAYIPVGGEMAPKGTEKKPVLPSTHIVYLDGELVEIEAYNIDGNNYFKLVDLAVAFDIKVELEQTKDGLIVNIVAGGEEDDADEAEDGEDADDGADEAGEAADAEKSAAAESDKAEAAGAGDKKDE